MKPGRVGSYRIEVGRQHAVTPSQIVGAIANEAGLDAKLIGQIAIFDSYSLVELPDGLPEDTLSHLQRVWVAGQKLRISRSEQKVPESSTPPARKTLGRKSAAGGGAGHKGDTVAGGGKPLRRKPKA